MVETQTLLLIPIIALLAGLAKGGLGGSLGGLITPMLSIIMPVQEALAISVPLFVVGDWLAVRAYWNQWDWAIVRWTLPLAVGGVVLGTYLLATLPNATLRVILGWLALVVGIYKLLEPRIRRLNYHPREWHGLLAGGLAGAGAALASAGGPTYSAYLLLRRLRPVPFIATTAIFFALVNLMRLPGYLLAGLFEWDVFRVEMLFLPLVWGGVWLGQRIVHHIDPVLFERVMIGLLLVAGVVLLS